MKLNSYLGMRNDKTAQLATYRQVRVAYMLDAYSREHMLEPAKLRAIPFAYISNKYHFK
ncbi:hypothetical protein NBRC116495_26140 [Aurantivibrio plasticivorans]